MASIQKRQRELSRAQKNLVTVLSPVFFQSVFAALFSPDPEQCTFESQIRRQEKRLGRVLKWIGEEI